MNALLAAGILGALLYWAGRMWLRAMGRDTDEQWKPPAPETVSPEARYNGACHNCKRRITGDMIDWKNHVDNCGRAR